jgi:hypothetical protein
MTFKLYIFFLILLVPNICFAWGPSSHITFNTFLIYNIFLITSPAVKKLILKYKNDFVYGSIAPDIFIGKGSLPKKHHSHNWKTAFNLFDNADNEEETVFSYGYLTHLAADVIAHNFFVPYHIFKFRAIYKTYSHVKAEASFESKLSENFLKLPKKVVDTHNRNLDIFLKKNIREKLTFNFRKNFFYRIIDFADSKFMQTQIRKKSDALSQEIFFHYLKINISVCADILNNMENSFLCSYDPVGSSNINSSKNLKNKLDSNPFKLPDILYNLNNKIELPDLNSLSEISGISDSIIFN